MDDLETWLREQLDEDEQTAKVATAGPWRWIDPGGKVKQALVADEYRDGRWSMVLPCANGDVFPSVFDAKHITRHDPASALREVEAKRRVVDLHVSDGAHECPCVNEGGYVWIGYEADCLTLKLLALPYSDRPGYREEWRPRWTW